MSCVGGTGAGAATEQAWASHQCLRAALLISAFPPSAAHSHGSRESHSGCGHCTTRFRFKRTEQSQEQRKELPRTLCPDSPVSRRRFLPHHPPALDAPSGSFSEPPRPSWTPPASFLLGTSKGIPQGQGHSLHKHRPLEWQSQDTSRRRLPQHTPQSRRTPFRGWNWLPTVPHLLPSLSPARFSVFPFFVC